MRRKNLAWILAVVLLPLNSVRAQESETPPPAESQAAETKSAEKETKPAVKDEQPAAKTEPKADSKKEKAEKKVAESKEGGRIEALEKKLDMLLQKIDSMSEEKPASAGDAEEPSSATRGPGARGDRPGAGRGPGGQRGPGARNPSAQRRPGGQRGSASGGNGRSARNAEQDIPAQLTLDSKTLEQFQWRSIGPANMSGRITDMDIGSSDPSLWWIATASGGLLKSTNQGVTLEHQFDKQSSVSIGAIAADPTNKDVVWVGTGEANPRNSVSYGDGVYKSVDGGKTFKHMGLKETYQIGRILVHPKDPNTVYVGALGRLYGPNRERGVYRTKDGGETWEQVLYVDDTTGVIDMIMHPEDPNVIIAALWDRLRDGFDSWPGSVEKPEGIDGYDPIRKWGPGAGLYKTSDGGDNWKKLSNGLPSNYIGRIGLDWQRGGKHAIYAIIDCQDIGKGPKPISVFLGIVCKDAEAGAQVSQIFPDSPAAKLGIELGDLVKKADGKNISNFEDLLVILRDKKLGDKISLEIERESKSMDLATKLAPRPGSQQQLPTVWLGVTGEDAKSEAEEEVKKIVLNSISKGGPAEKAGLKAKDIIVSANEKPVKGYEALIETVRAMSAGEELKLSIEREGEAKELTVVLANRPTQTRQTQSNAYMGIQGEDNPGGGAKLTVVTPGGPSQKAGVKAGDIVIKVGEKELKSYQDLITEIRSKQPEDKMPLKVKRGEKEVELVVTLGDRRGSGGNSDRPYTYSYFGQRPNVQDMQGADGHEYGGIYRSLDAGETWERVNSLNTRPMYFSVIRVDPEDDQRVYVLGVSQFKSTNGGITFESNFGRGVHADAHDLWIDDKDGRHMVIGGDGGFYVSYDYGTNWDHVNTAAIGQFYHVAISPKKPYWVVGGLQDNGSWAGPAISRSGGALNEDWISVGGGDGFVCRVDPNDPDLMYYESQNGSMGRRHLVTGERSSIRPQREQGMEYRFNWETPFILSNHNSKIFYCAGNYVFRSLDRGNNLQRISPEITLTKRGSATDMAESPRDSNVLFVGTDDGALWVTRDGGKEWTDITKNLNAPRPMWVASVEASRFSASRVYVTLDGHRSDDDNPYAYVSDDYGQTFKPLHRDLPRGSTRCLREDIGNENLLYLGTEFGFWVSVDRGQNWTQFNQKLPVVAIHDVAIHPTNGEIVLATHGRSLWACNMNALRGLDAKKFNSEANLLAPGEVVRWRTAPSRGRTNRRYVGQNPPRGVALWYSLPKDAKSAKLTIKDISGQTVAELNGDAKKGLHRLSWDLTRSGSNGARGRGGFSRSRFVASGTYSAQLKVDDADPITQTITIQSDPVLPVGAVADEVYEEMLFIEEQAAKRKSQDKSLGIDYSRGN